MKLNKKLLAVVLAGLMTMTVSGLTAEKAQVKETGNAKGAVMQLEQKWDKTFPQSSKVDHKKITFHNRYGVTLVADMYIPKNSKGKKLDENVEEGR